MSPRSKIIVATVLFSTGGAAIKWCGFGAWQLAASVSVAILDTGIDYLWPDLAGRVDLSRSISLRPDEDARLATWFGALGRHPITDLNAHGTLVSTVVASNSGFFAGVTTRTTLFGVKVCIVFNTCSNRRGSQRHRVRRGPGRRCD